MFGKLVIHSLLIVTLPVAAWGQDPGTLDPKPLPPLARPDDPKTPAKELFGRQSTPAPITARALGWYAKGCLAGARALPVNGPSWQVMRLSRNRNWGHPNLVAVLERIAEKGKKLGWNGLLVGDMSQPRGGPMLTGHASHQVGLDADVWLTPMPNRQLSRNEREEMSAVMMVASDRKDVDKSVWTRGQTAVKLAAMLRARGEASAFPSAQLMLDGWMENALVSEPATAVEDRYREILRASPDARACWGCRLRGSIQSSCRSRRSRPAARHAGWSTAAP